VIRPKILFAALALAAALTPPAATLAGAPSAASAAFAPRSGFGAAAAAGAAFAPRPSEERARVVAVERDTTVQELPFIPFPSDSFHADAYEPEEVEFTEDTWLRAPFGDDLLTDPDQWRSEGHYAERTGMGLDYNRVDGLRLTLSHQLQRPETMLPRLGARIEYAFGRERTLYGVQFEQPLAPPGRLALGVSMVRRTDHSELQQMGDLENTLTFLFARQDFRDYFEREGFGAYLSWRVPDFSTVSLHVRNDEYRSLAADHHNRSWFNTDTPLRENPQVEEGEAHSVILRLERLAHRTGRTRAGLYHWIELERAGGGLKGDFDYTRLLGDVRSVLRLTPASTLSLRFVAGHTFDDTLPRQKQFTLGGVDGLRAHDFSEFVGNELALMQAEFTLGMWQMHHAVLEGGMHAIAFVDMGRAWSNPAHQWDVGRQQFQVDGGFGLATTEDGLRVYVARDLQDPGSDFVFSLRLQAPF
jgi:surface antigen Omp85-like protein